MTDKLFQIGDTIRATASIVSTGMRSIQAGRLYGVRDVRTVPGEGQDVRLEGRAGWYAASNFYLESIVPDNFQLKSWVRRIKAGHGGLVEGGQYRIVGINRKLGLIKLEGFKASFRASSFQLVEPATPAPLGERINLTAFDAAFRAATEPVPQAAKTVGWKDEDGNITVNPNVAAEWITGGRKSKVERVYVLAA